MTVNMPDILLVEDNPADAKLTMLSLQKSHIQNPVVHVHDGVEALDYLFRKNGFAGRLPVKPVFVLLDLKMPRVDGLEVLEKIKKDPELKSIPVAVFTSSAEDPDIKRSYALGANSYIVKPMDVEAFRKVIFETSMYWGIINEVPKQ